MDYDYLPTCAYEVDGHPYPGDCGEPAVARVWWDDGSEMLVCQEHLDFMVKCEAKVEKAPAPPAGDAL